MTENNTVNRSKAEGIRAFQGHIKDYDDAIDGYPVDATPLSMHR